MKTYKELYDKPDLGIYLLIYFFIFYVVILNVLKMYVYIAYCRQLVFLIQYFICEM